MGSAACNEFNNDSGVSSVFCPWCGITIDDKKEWKEHLKQHQ